MRFLKCDECETMVATPWFKDGWILDLDSNTTQEQIDSGYAIPYTASHLEIISNQCDYCGSKYSENVSCCLVNHGDNTACVICSECNKHNSHHALWHNTKWEISDIIEKDIDETIELPDDIIREKLKCDKFELDGRLRDLE